MQTQVVSGKGASPQVLSVDAHAGYAAAKARMTELCARRDRAKEDLAAAKKELAGYAGPDIEAEARAVVNGKRNDDSLGRRLSGQVASLQKELDVLRQACRMQSETVGELQGIASFEIVQSVRPEYRHLRHQFFLALVELGKRAEALSNWREKLNQTGADGMGCELGVADIVGSPRTIGDRAIGSPTLEDANIIVNLRQALERGDIRRDEIPSHWKVY